MQLLLSMQRSIVASQMSKNEVQSDILESRKMTIEKDVSALSDTDLAEMITKFRVR